MNKLMNKIWEAALPITDQINLKKTAIFLILLNIYIVTTCSA
jgi:hypothetical protein